LGAVRGKGGGLCLACPVEASELVWALFIAPGMAASERVRALFIAPCVAARQPS